MGDINAIPLPSHSMLFTASPRQSSLCETGGQFDQMTSQGCISPQRDSEEQSWNLCQYDWKKRDWKPGIPACCMQPQTHSPLDRTGHVSTDSDPEGSYCRVLRVGIY